MTIFKVRDVLFLFSGYPYITIRCNRFCDTVEFCGVLRDVPDCLLERDVLYLSAKGENSIEIVL